MIDSLCDSCKFNDGYQYRDDNQFEKWCKKEHKIYNWKRRDDSSQRCLGCGNYEKDENKK